MFSKFLPKQNNFFELFQAAAEQLVSAAQEFSAMLKDLTNAENHAKTISDYEDTGDNIALATFDLLHKTFITPFDRNDIHELTRQLDDILDLINRTAQRITVYKLVKLPVGIQAIADIIVSATNHLKNALEQLANLKNSSEIIKHCRDIGAADSKAEQIMLEGVGQLFVEETDIKYLLKAKEIFEYSKMIITECHDLADVIKGIVLEYS